MFHRTPNFGLIFVELQHVMLEAIVAYAGGPSDRIWKVQIAVNVATCFRDLLFGSLR